MKDFFKEIKKGMVYQKLLDYGLFSEKLTPIFTSRQFGQWVRKKGINTYKSRSFSTIRYRLTRNNNAPRIIEIPHPIAYFRLCEEIKDNWSELIQKFGEIDDYAERSMVIPKPSNLNKRLVSMMSYDKRDDEKFLILDKSAGKKYLVHADIANCYPSIYSHSVSWALVGHQEAKDNSDDKTKWYNKFDFAIRSMQRNETVGIAIGPDTSSLISELILSRVDKELEKYEYIRFIDDYRCYVKSQEDADEFVRKLSKELERYHLRLNPKKTKIIELPTPIDADWVRSLREYSTKFLKKKKFSADDVNTLSEFIDLSIRLSKEHPSDSPLRYSVKILASKRFMDEKSLTFVLMYLSRICFIYPYFIDVLDDLLKRNKKRIKGDIVEILKKEVNTLTKEHIKYSRSDVALWGLTIALKHDIELDDFEAYSDQLIADRDCLPTFMCYRYAKKKGFKTDKYFNLIDQLIKEKLEEDWWLYIYELYRDKSTKPQLKKIQYKDFYEELRKGKVSFVK